MAAERVSFPSENRAGNGQGVLVGNRKAQKGLIVIHEWWGLNEQIEQSAVSIAEESGFLVLVPDMYRGALATDREDAGHLMDGLDWPGALHDISGAALYLKSLGCTGVGATGFCMGGALCFAAAVACTELSGVAPFYGCPRRDVVDITTARIPIQAHFGEKDEIKGFSSPEDYEPLRKDLEAAGVPLEFHTYNAGHAFTNIANPNYDKDIASLALGRMYEFMKAKL